uniref:FAD-dependent oxidoreductase n=1 Tax=Escherichia coli TaxID=562 RepID=UPI0019534ADB
ILSFLEHEHGIFHPVGGCGAVSAAMASVAERLGARIHLGEPVRRIAYRDGRPCGVETDAGFHPAQSVVVNG